MLRRRIRARVSDRRSGFYRDFFAVGAWTI
jgi:hypothetical protein